MSDLLYDVSWEILLRLPAESLFRFRCVSKAWRRMIDDPSFIRAHTHHQLHNHTLLVGDETGDPLYSFSLDSLDFINGSHIIDATPIKPFVRKWVLHLPNLAVVASCNGLLLLSHQHWRSSRRVWAIWNPLTNDCRQLPEPDAPLNLFGAPLNLLGYGFGYDYNSDDYKIVRINDADSVGLIGFQIQVYSLKSNSWRMIEDYPCGSLLGRDVGAFLDGKLYWTSMDGRVIVFDLKTEKFFEFPLPPQSDEYETSDGLDAVGGCLIYSVNYHSRNQLDGWMMKDNGWIKFFKLPYPFHIEPGLLRVVHYSKKKMQVLLHSREDDFMWFDLENNSAKAFHIDGLDSFNIVKICPGSLVRLNLGCGAVTSRKRKSNTNREDTRLMGRLKLMVSDADE